jgi:hypothetical protein
MRTVLANLLICFALLFVTAGNASGAVVVANSRMAELEAKWGHLSAAERRTLLDAKVEANAERWVSGYEHSLNQRYPGLDAHFAELHGPDIPLRPNLELRAVNGTNPRTGLLPSRPRAQSSSQFRDWVTQRDVLNEAVTREARGLPKYNHFDRYGNPAVIGSNPGGVGWGFTPNRLSPSSPIYNPQLNGWIVRFDATTGVPFTAYPTR